MTRRLSAQARARIVAEYAAGESSVVLAERYGVSASTVTKCARDAGVSRPVGRRPRPVEDPACHGRWVRDGLILRPVP